jgi:hypothetical protein
MFRRYPDPVRRAGPGNHEGRGVTVDPLPPSAAEAKSDQISKSPPQLYDFPVDNNYENELKKI